MSQGTPDENVYYVFRRQDDGAPLTEVGSVDASSVELAKIYAKENYARRRNTTDLVVIPKTEMHHLGIDTAYGGAFDKEYREDRGYEEVEGFTA